MENSENTEFDTNSSLEAVEQTETEQTLQNDSLDSAMNQASLEKDDPTVDSPNNESADEGEKENSDLNESLTKETESLTIESSNQDESLTIESSNQDESLTIESSNQDESLTIESSNQDEDSPDQAVEPCGLPDQAVEPCGLPDKAVEPCGLPDQAVESCGLDKVEAKEGIDQSTDDKATQDKSPKQSARKAANLRAKFEKWENGKNDVNKGSDEEGEEAMPSIDTARNLRKMFENKATEQPVPVNKPKHKVNRFVGGGGEKCVKCSKTVYALERLEVVGKVLHKRCFKCAKCKSTLGMGNFSVGGENYYCTTHYKQMFAEKGTYDVFTPDKGKWTRKIEASNGEAPKSQE